MKTLKIIYAVLSLNALVVSGYAVDKAICTKDGLCFEIIVKNPLDPDPIDDQEWGEASFANKVLRNLKWDWLSKDEQTTARINHMKRLLRGAKIRVNGKELEVMSDKVEGLKESAVIHSINDYYYCIIRLVIGNPQRTFDLTVRKFKDMDLAVRNAEEIPRAEYLISKPNELPSEDPEKKEDIIEGIIHVSSIPVSKQELLDAANQQTKELRELLSRYEIESSDEVVVGQIKIALQELKVITEELKEANLENEAIRQSFKDQLDRKAKEIRGLTQDVMICRDDLSACQENYEKLKQEYMTEQEKLKKLKEDHEKLAKEVNKIHQEALNQLNGLEDNIPVYVDTSAKAVAMQRFELISLSEEPQNLIPVLKQQVDGMKLMGFASKDGVLKNNDKLWMINNGKEPWVSAGNNLHAIVQKPVKGTDDNEYRVKISAELKTTDEILQLNVVPGLVFNKKPKAYFVKITDISETPESKKARDAADKARTAEETLKAEIKLLKTAHPVYLDLSISGKDDYKFELKYEKGPAIKLGILPNEVQGYTFMGYTDGNGHLKGDEINLFINDQGVRKNVPIEAGQVKLEGVEFVDSTGDVKKFNVTLEVLPFNVPVITSSEVVSGFKIKILKVEKKSTRQERLKRLR